MAKETKVTLGGREYTIAQKQMGAAAKWRRRLGESRVMAIVQTLDVVVGQFTSIASDMKEGGVRGIDIAQAFGLTRILPAITDGLLNSVDEVWGLVFEYAPVIEKDRKWLEENAYDEEGVAAFMEVLKLNFPISALWALVTGRKEPQTQQNSPSPNGVSGLPASGPQPKKVKTS